MEWNGMSCCCPLDLFVFGFILTLALAFLLNGLACVLRVMFCPDHHVGWFSLVLF